MRRASNKINLVVSHISENLKGPNSDDKIRRAERRLRRWESRELNRNESFQRNFCASATRIAVMSRGNKSVVTDNNGHMVEDVEYKMFLDPYVSHIDVDRDNHVDGSDIDAITGYNNDDDPDPHYKLFLENLRQEGKSYVSSVIVGNQLVHIRYEEEEEEEEAEAEEEEEEEEEEGGGGGGGGSPVESLQSQQTERAPCNKRPRSEVSSVLKNNCNSESELVDVDEDYRIFLNPSRIDGNSEEESEESGSPVESLQCQEDERSPGAVDEDYRIFLNSYGIDGNAEEEAEEESEESGSPVESLQCQETERAPGAVDEDYRIFLNSYGKVGNAEEEESEELGSPVESLQSQETERAPGGAVDEDYRIFLNSYRIDGNAERGPCNKRPHSEVSRVPKNNCNSEQPGAMDEDYRIFLNSYGIGGNSLVYGGSELKGKSLSVRQNSQISDPALNTPVAQCDIDQDYRLFLNSARIIDGNSVDMRDRNITKKYNVETGSNASDPDLILLEPHQICENSPFISSKTYDSSWFENVKNPRDSGQFPAYDHSQFKRRLLEYLEKPYDQKEYDKYMQEVRCRRHKERHRETRQGVVKSYHVDGVNKSYFEEYPDLAKAIAEFKDPHRVLFLLRGFMFWLQNVSHDGIFRPWLDESCLEILRKM